MKYLRPSFVLKFIIVKSICFTASFFCLMSAQNNTNNLPSPDLNLLPVSPEMSGFMRYGDVPVSEYTGTPNISIPIYTVKYKDLSLPISLSYQSNAVRVSQEATWCGLGWDLIAGGCISYVVVGGNDRHSVELNRNEWAKAVGYVKKSNSLLYGTTYEDCLGNDWTPSSQCMIPNGCLGTDLNLFIASALSGRGEQDFYAVNFLNYSFKFIIHPVTGMPSFLGPKNNCKINLVSEDGQHRGFEIIDEKGIKYLFLDREFNNTERGYYNAWFLSKITSPKGNIIDLVYKQAMVNPLPVLTENVVLGSYPEDLRSGYKRKISTSSFIQSLYLHRIITPEQTVEFESNNTNDHNGRLDLKNAYRLNGIRVYNGNSMSNNQPKSLIHFVFGYDYFTSCEVGGNYLNDDNWNKSLNSFYSYDNLSKRLKLTSLRRVVPDDPTKHAEEYGFEYDEVYPLPLKTSFAIDHWGYYNGQHNLSNLMNQPQQVDAKHTLIPDYRALFVYDKNYGRMEGLPFFSSLRGAIRGTSAKYIGAGMLKRIKYPTGGWTNYLFEPHTYSNSKTISAEDEEKEIGYRSKFTTYQVLVFPLYKSSAITSFEIKKETLVNVKADIVCGNDGACSTASNSWLRLWQTNSWSLNGTKTLISSYYVSKQGGARQGNNNSWTETIVLQPGIYFLESDITCFSNCNGYDKFVAGAVEVPVEPKLNTDPSIGGGVRIRRIESFDKNGMLVSKRVYNYHGGTLIKPLSYGMTNEGVKYIKVLDTQTGITARSYSYDVCNISSNNYFGAAQSYDGTVVGYQKVEVENVDVANSATNGKTVSYYSCIAPFIHHNRPITLYGLKNGNLLEQVNISAEGDTISVINNDYAILDSEIEPLNILVRDIHAGSKLSCFAYLGRYEMVFYPHVSFRNLLVKHKKVDFFRQSGGATVLNSKVVATTNYEYKSQLGYLLGSETFEASKGHVIKVEYEYPSFDVEEEKQMLQRNMLEVVKTKRYYPDDFTETNQKTYKFINRPGGIISFDKVYYWQNNNEPQILVSYQVYDDFCNVTQYETPEGLLSIFWGYNHQYPTAKIENYTNNALESNSALKTKLAQLETFTTMADSAARNSLGQLNAEIRSLLPAMAMATTYTYSPLLGMTSQTDPAGRTTYYEYDAFGRLEYVRDQDGHILNKYEYKYATQP